MVGLFFVGAPGRALLN